jgi:6-phosphofructokinase 1
MNCAVRAIVRTAIGKNLEPIGIRRGYAGLLEENFWPMEISSVGNILQQGGTILQSSRCPEFKEKAGRKKAADILKKHSIDGLVVIGGDGSFNGAWALWEEHKIPVIGVPGTIDNDIDNTDYTIGFDTAVQTAVEAVDKIRDTASSHERTFIIEVMGRNSSAIAMHVGICTGAENIVFPADEVDYEQIVGDIKRGVARGKNSSIIICAEGKISGRSYELQSTLSKKYGLDSRLCILGHVQRGGSPSAIDRFLASSMGYQSVLSLIEGNYPLATVFNEGVVTTRPLSDCLKNKGEYLPHYIDLVKALSI